MLACAERRRVGFRACLLVLVLASLACERPGNQLRERVTELTRPNIVIFLVDTLRADWTSPYSFVHDTTPEIGRWAARGVVFEQTRSQSSWTKISMASLMTSLWPRSHGITEADDGLAETAVTLAEVLRDAGYATHGVQTNGWLHQSFGFHQGFDRYLFPLGGRHPSLERSTIWPHADRVHDEALRLIADRDPQRPFFLYLHFMDVHEYAAPNEFKIYGTNSRGAYLAAIRWVDDAIERVRKALDEAGVLDETILVFAADHGETFGEHGVHGHARNVLTPVVWVPWVMRLPFALKIPVRISTQVRNLDIAPTLLDLAGLKAPGSFEGRSLLPLLAGEVPAQDLPAFARLGMPLFRNASTQAAIHEGAWTYARNAESDPNEENERRFKAVAPGAEFLFDRRVDPAEDVNLALREPRQTERLRELLREHMAGGTTNVREQGVRIDPAIANRLRAMGYLQ